MLTKWFGTRALRSAKKDLSFRPWLESLEDRNAPSGLGPMDDHGPGHGHGNGNDDHGPPGPPPPPAGVSNGISSNVNAHGSFNGSTITDSFNNTINNSTVVLMPGQQIAVQGLLGLSGLFASTLNSPQLGSLLNDEIALAVDTYLDSIPMVASVLPSLANDKTVLSAAISANPLDSSLIGQALGTLAFNATMAALTSTSAQNPLP
jgi:hypothetical protein